MNTEKRKTMIYAHRGASEKLPENTLAAFAEAVRMGADGVELDVQACASGELVVAHDEWLERVSDGSGWIAQTTLTELKKLNFSKTHPEFGHAEIPTLREVFDLLKNTRLGINIELKNSLIPYPNLEERVLEEVNRWFSADRVIFSSFSHASMVRMKALDAGVMCGLLYSASLVNPWDYARKLGVDALHPQFFEVITPGGECRKAHEAGIRVHTWTVDREDAIRRVLEEGADILITNRPDAALVCLQEQAGKGSAGNGQTV